MLCRDESQPAAVGDQPQADAGRHRGHPARERIEQAALALGQADRLEARFPTDQADMAVEQ
jgi:hypothetical protein